MTDPKWWEPTDHWLRRLEPDLYNTPEQREACAEERKRKRRQWMAVAPGIPFDEWLRHEEEE